MPKKAATTTRRYGSRSPSPDPAGRVRFANRIDRLLTIDGVPVRSWIFPGNPPDVATVIDDEGRAATRLRGQFSVAPQGLLPSE